MGLTSSANRNRTNLSQAKLKLAPCDCSDEGFECPICFLNYPQINSTSCCNQDMCTNCYQKLSKRSTCVFCNSNPFSIVFDEKKTYLASNDAYLVKNSLLAPVTDAPSIVYCSPDERHELEKSLQKMYHNSEDSTCSSGSFTERTNNPSQIADIDLYRYFLELDNTDPAIFHELMELLTTDSLDSRNNIQILQTTVPLSPSETTLDRWNVVDSESINRSRSSRDITDENRVGSNLAPVESRYVRDPEHNIDYLDNDEELELAIALSLLPIDSPSSALASEDVSLSLDPQAE